MMYFSFIVGISLAFSRSGLGLNSALTSRYRIFSMLFVLGCFYLYLDDDKILDIFSNRIIKSIFILLFIGLFMFNWAVGILIGRSWVGKYKILEKKRNK